jgi:hypothetical protein
MKGRGNKRWLGRTESGPPVNPYMAEHKYPSLSRRKIRMEAVLMSIAHGGVAIVNH